MAQESNMADAMRQDYLHFADEYRAATADTVVTDDQVENLYNSVQAGLQQSADGDVADLGDFVVYAPV